MPRLKSIKNGKGKYTQMELLEHMKKKGMWGGCKEIVEDNIFVVKVNKEGPYISEKEISFTPLWYKMVDEIMVNAIDHWVKNPKKVKQIFIEFYNDGTISIMNDGPGISIYKTNNLKGNEIYSVQLISAEPLTSEHHDENERITGGVNGIGMKLANCFSEKFTIETTDTDTKTNYTQTFKNQLLEIGTPTLTKTSKFKGDEKWKKKGYTRITFKPLFVELGYKRPFDKDGNLKLDIYKMMNKLIRTRAYQASAFAKVDVVYQGEKIKSQGFHSFCNLFNFTNKVDIVLGDKKETTKWEITIGNSNGKFQHFSLINGIYVYEGGTHIKWLKDQIITGLEKKITTELKKDKIQFNKNTVLNTLFICVKFSIANPKFDSQIKNTLKDTKVKTKYGDFVFSKSNLTKIWNEFKDNILIEFRGKQNIVQTKVNRGRIDFPKYQEAKYAGNKKKGKNCRLVICEGDSAYSMVKNGLNNIKKSDEKYGIFSIQGVPINIKENTKKVKIYNGKKKNNCSKSENNCSRKRKSKSENNCSRKRKSKSETEFDEDNRDEDDKSKKRKDSGKLSVSEIKKEMKKDNSEYISTITKFTDKYMKDTNRMKHLVRILGLDFNKKYETQKEIDELRYGGVILAVDADVDGMGQIGGLLLCLFVHCFPNLVRAGYFQRFNTPIIRAYQKGKGKKFLEFYTQGEFDEWKDKKFHNSDDLLSQKYSIEYYKGLGSHEDNEVEYMFEHFHKRLITYTYDSMASKTFEMYYGKDTSLRKKVLRTTVDEKQKGNLIPCSLFCNTDVKEFQRENIIRKLAHIADGMVPSRRKVLYAIRKIFANSNKPIKVANLVGNIMKISAYHHGDMSITQTIIKMTQTIRQGGKNLPYLFPVGNFGHLCDGGKAHASARYIRAIMNKTFVDLAFPKEFDYVLPYTFVDGERVEPEYFVPIIPMAILESMELPAHGWKYKVWARKYSSVAKNLKMMIMQKQEHYNDLPYWKSKFEGIQVYNNKGDIWAIAEYEYNKDDNTIHITKLPPMMYSYKLCCGTDKEHKNKEKNKKKKEDKKGKTINAINKSPYIRAPCRDRTHDEKGVDITIYLKEGVMKDIRKKYQGNDDAFDAVINCFGLKNRMDDNINMINEKGVVVEYKNYKNVADDHFKLCKKVFKASIKRNLILLQQKLEMYQELLRCNGMYEKFKFNKNTKIPDKEKVYKENNFIPFNTSILFNPRYTPVEQLYDEIRTYNTSYEYLWKRYEFELGEEGTSKYKQKIKELKAEIKEITRNDDDLKPWQRIWLQRLEKLNKEIQRGTKEDWMYLSPTNKYFHS